MAIQFLNTVQVDTSVLYVDTANDKVGIGTTSPSSILDVSFGASASNTAQINLNGASGAAAELVLRAGGDDNGTIYNRRAAIRYYSNQISTTTAQWVNGVSMTQTTGDDKFYFNNSGNSTVLCLQQNGRVGINTATPTQELHVQGGMRLTGAFVDKNVSAGSYYQVLSSTQTGTDWVDASSPTIIGGPYLPLAGGTMDSGAEISFDNNNSLGQSFVKSGGSLNLIIDSNNNSNSANLIIEKNTQTAGSGTELFRVQENGSVGIGTTTPQSKLQVAGGIQMADDTDTASATKVGTMRYRTGTEYVEVTGTELITNGDFASSTDWVLKNSASINNGTGVATVPGAGALGATNGNWSLSQASVFAVSTLYRVRFQARRDAGTASEMYVGQSYNLIFNQVLTTAWVEHEVVFTSTSNAGWSNLSFGGVVGTTSEVKEVSVMEVTSEDASYADMCMQTGASTYEWVNIVRNTY